jgi:hypothetical protein
MRKLLLVGIAAIALNACQTMGSGSSENHVPIAGVSQTIVNDDAGNTIVQSSGKRIMVALSRATSGQSRPFARFGSVFTISVVNLGGKSVELSPDSVTVEVAGQAFPAMSTGRLQAVAAKIDAEKQSELQARQFFGQMLGQLGGQITDANVATVFNIGTKVMEMDTAREIQNAEEARAEAGALIQQHAKHSLSRTRIGNMKAAGGWVLVDSVGAASTYQVRVNVDGEVHRFRFGLPAVASR